MPWIDYDRLSGSGRALFWGVVLLIGLGLGVLLVVVLSSLGVGPEDVPTV